MLQSIIETYPDVQFVVLTGLDAAIIGVDDQHTRLVYSVSAIIDILMEQGMGDDEAREYYDYNIFGLHLNEGMPILCDDTFYDHNP